MEKIEIGRLILILIGMFLLTLGTILIYNRKKKKKKFFSFTDQNNGSFIIKVSGVAILVIGGSVILFN